MNKLQDKPEGKLSELPADALKIVVEETSTRVGMFAAFLKRGEGQGEETICTSANPLSDSAVILLERGYAPERVIVQMRRGNDFYDLRSQLGAAAGFAQKRERKSGRES